MNFKILTAAPVLAMLAMSPAMAGDTKAQPGTPNTIQQNIEKGWNKTKETVSEAASDVGQAGKEAYEDVKYTFFGAGSDKGVAMTVDSRATARGILGKPVLNMTGERVGTLKDIILDNNGKAILAVVSEATFMDLGRKTAAFDYALVTRQNAEGDIVMPLAEETIKNARSFSYDMEEDAADRAAANAILPPSNGYSVEELLESNVVNEKGHTVAHVDNIVFRNGMADSLIVSFGKILGMGGKNAALAFSDVKAVRDQDDDEDDFGEDVDFQLTAAQAARFETFKSGVSN